MNSTLLKHTSPTAVNTHHTYCIEHFAEALQWPLKWNTSCKTQLNTTSQCIQLHQCASLGTELFVPGKFVTVRVWNASRKTDTFALICVCQKLSYKWQHSLSRLEALNVTMYRCWNSTKPLVIFSGNPMLQCHKPCAKLLQHHSFNS